MPATRTQKEIRQRAPLWLIGLLALNLALMLLSARDQTTHERLVRTWGQTLLAPVQSVVSGAGGAGAGIFQRIANLGHASAENEELKGRVAALETEVREARAARDENERLKNLLGLKEESKFAPVVARVIARDPSDWFDTITINRGRSSGIENNMPVVTREGIVGRVVGTSQWTAQVMLITDERAAAGAIVGQLGASNALGSVRGYGKNGLLEMRYVSGLEPVKEGDYVITTGQDGIYPPGLNVGEVVEVRQGTATTPHEIKVKPSAHLNSLEEVAVLLYHPPQRVAPDMSLPNMDKGGRK